MALKSLTRGLDLPDGSAKGKPAPSDRNKGMVKIAVIVVCLILSAVAVSYNFGLFGSADDQGPAAKAAPGAQGEAKTREELMAGRRQPGK